MRVLNSATVRRGAARRRQSRLQLRPGQVAPRWAARDGVLCDSCRARGHQSVLGPGWGGGSRWRTDVTDRRSAVRWVALVGRSLWNLLVWIRRNRTVGFLIGVSLPRSAATAGPGRQLSLRSCYSGSAVAGTPTPWAAPLVAQFKGPRSFTTGHARGQRTRTAPGRNAPQKRWESFQGILSTIVGNAEGHLSGSLVQASQATFER